MDAKDLLPRRIDDQLHFHYSQLTNWEKNNKAREISEENWKKLIDDVKLNGIEDAFKIGEDGVVYDGNNRLKAVKYLIEEEGMENTFNGRPLAWIPVVVKHPKSEAEKWRYAFTRNEQFANWNKDELLNFQTDFEELDMALVNIDFDAQESVEEQLSSLEKTLPKEKKEYGVTIEAEDAIEENLIYERMVEQGFKGKKLSK